MLTVVRPSVGRMELLYTRLYIVLKLALPHLRLAPFFYFSSAYSLRYAAAYGTEAPKNTIPKEKDTIIVRHDPCFPYR